MQAAPLLRSLAAVVLVVTSVGIARAQTQHAVSIVDSPTLLDTEWGFDAPELTIGVGDSVIWTHVGSIEPHTVTAEDGSWDAGQLQPGDTFAYTFTSPGVYTYYCVPHPWMKGSIIVGNAAPAPTEAPIPEQEMPPDVPEVPPGEPEMPPGEPEMPPGEPEMPMQGAAGSSL
jgi:plastocyanin